MSISDPSNKNNAGTAAIDQAPFKGTMTREQFSYMQKFAVPWWGGTGFFLVSLVIFDIYIIGWARIVERPLAAAVASLPLAFGFFLYTGLIHFLKRKAWNTHNTLHGEVHGVVSDSELVWSTAITKTTFPWSKVIKAKKTNELVLIFYTRRCFFFFPRNFFATESDWEKFNAIVDRNTRK